MRLQGVFVQEDVSKGEPLVLVSGDACLRSELSKASKLEDTPLPFVTFVGERRMNLAIDAK